MKSERRHELQHNTLADWLVNSAETIKPYQNMLFAALVVIVIAVAGYTWWSRESARQTTQAWDALNSVLEGGNVTKLAQVIEDYPNTTVADMAAVVLADYRLGAGCDQLFTNKATAQDDLNRATSLYELVRQESRLPSLQERATFGLARVKEANGDLERAEQLYDEVATKWPDGAFAAEASRRVADLKRPATKIFYDDFRKFEPKVAFTKEPGERPSFDLNSLPGEGSLAPAVSDLKLGGEEKGKAEEGKAKPPDETGKKK